MNNIIKLACFTSQFDAVVAAYMSLNYTYEHAYILAQNSELAIIYYGQEHDYGIFKIYRNEDSYYCVK